MDFLWKINCPADVSRKVIKLANAPEEIPANPGSVQELAENLWPSNIYEWSLVMVALECNDDAFRGVYAVANQYNCLYGKPAKYLTGKDLVDYKLTPGPVFTYILGKAWEAQVKGEINDVREALGWLNTNFSTMMMRFAALPKNKTLEQFVEQEQTAN